MSINLADEEFRLGEVAKFVFDQSITWLRNRTLATNGRLPDAADPDGTVPGRRSRNYKRGGGDRVYNLAECARIANNLHRNGRLDDAALSKVMSRLSCLSIGIWGPGEEAVAG